ncbi:MAG: formylglycine-generating enzyme family protein [Candidatus Nitrospinota bacterium M3_3B_026]
MVEVPGGEFKSGPDLKVVKVDSFAIDKYEVTNAKWKEFKEDFDIPAGKENHPVTEVSYFEAAEYCKSQDKRIPTALEWEKAARGADGRLYPWGNEFDKNKANTLESGVNGTTPVGDYEAGASPYGALNMTGNVWEWTDGWGDESMKQYRLTMGGSFFDDKSKGKVFSTLKSIPDDIHTYIGFRCAK